MHPGRSSRRVLAERGRVDVIVNNAATFRLKAIDEFTLEEFDEHVAVKRPRRVLPRPGGAPLAALLARRGRS